MTDARKRFVDRVRDGEVEGLFIDPDNPAMAYYSMPLDCPVGAKVRFTGHGGYESDQQHASRFLKVNEFYTVMKLEVGDWSSRVKFWEFPYEWFNTVMFEEPLPKDIPTE